MIDTMLLVVATEMEVDRLLYLMEEGFTRLQPAYRPPGQTAQFQSYKIDDRLVDILITGVGMTATALQLGSYLSYRRAIGEGHYQLAVNAGIAGSFSKHLIPGDMVEVLTDRFSDLGAEDADGSFLDLFKLGLMKKKQPPFGKKGVLRNPYFGFFGEFPGVHGVTVNKAHGSKRSISKFLAKEKPKPYVETMESAAFFLTCLEFGQRFSSIRAISNRVKPRNKAEWDLPVALSELTRHLRKLVYEDYDFDIEDDDF